MEETTRISLTLDEVTAFKRLVTGDASFADRISLGFAMRLAWLQQETGDNQAALFEIQHLEQGIPTTTKPAEQFKHAPLQPFWHKHYFSSRHLLRNIGERWNIARGLGNRDLDAMIKQVASGQGHDPAMWPKLLTYVLSWVAFKSVQKLTGSRGTGSSSPSTGEQLLPRFGHP